MRIVSENKFLSLNFAFLFSLRFFMWRECVHGYPPQKKKEEKKRILIQEHY